MPKIIAVTPAGRRRYLELLTHYITQDESIDEWQLWDNCRSESDRVYINQLPKKNGKIRIVTHDGTNGSNSSINKFYRGLDDKNAFYIKMDDDLVYLPPNFGAALYEASRHERGRYLWWSPLVINNAICSWILKHHSGLEIDTFLSAQAADQNGWASPYFAECLHRIFINSIRDCKLSCFETPCFEISLSRFSINCIVLPSRLGRVGRVQGNLIVGHFAYYIQEPHLLNSDLLEQYYEIAGLVLLNTRTERGHWWQQVKRLRRLRPRRVTQSLKRLRLIRLFKGGPLTPMQPKDFRISLKDPPSIGLRANVFRQASSDLGEIDS
jgi:hypothetical protein